MLSDTHTDRQKEILAHTLTHTPACYRFWLPLAVLNFSVVIKAGVFKLHIGWHVMVSFLQICFSIRTGSRQNNKSYIYVQINITDNNIDYIDYYRHYINNNLFVLYLSYLEYITYKVTAMSKTDKPVKQVVLPDIAIVI